MADEFVLQQIDQGVGRLTLNRPDKHNAFDDHLIAQLTAALLSLEADRRVRVVVLAAAGESFSAGADLAWMKRVAGYCEAENLEDARALAGLMSTLDRLAKPTVALVQGPAFGGGVGLVACCDVAIAAESASFSLSEVRLGLIPAVISPYVVAAMGPRAARRFVLTAERFTARQACDLGLVHEVVPGERLEEAGRQVLAHLFKGGPRAQSEAKDLVLSLAGRPIDRALVEETAERIARIRAGDEAREGLAAFLEKRKANWQDA
jgi:methylglutaconyl-CoA hydratase